MKNLYIFLVIGLGIFASVFVYFSVQGSTEESIDTLSKTSKKIARSINACKNARIEINGDVFQLVNEISTIPNIIDKTETITLRYGKHAVRGTMDSGAVNDMVCTYDLDTGDGKIKTYVSALLGQTEDLFVPTSALLIGENITVNSLTVVNGKAIVSVKDNKTGAITEKKAFLEGDILTFL